MKRLLSVAAVVIAGVACASCATTTRVDVSEGIKDVRISPADGSLAVALRTPTLEVSEKGAIMEKRSFALYQDGTRYGIIAKPNEYANNYPEKSFWVSDYIWLRAANGDKMNWKHGEWRLLLVLQSASGEKSYKVGFKMSSQTFSMLDWNGEF